jgi:hypothetical protein
MKTTTVSEVRARALLPAFVLALWTVGPGSGVVLAQDAVTLERDPRPKLFVTDFAWYRPNQRPDGGVEAASLACARAQPRRAFGDVTATDYLSSDGYYGEKYKRFKSHGIDGIAFLVTDRIPDSFDGGNVVQLAQLAAAADLDFFAYYDLFVNTAKTSGLYLCLGGGGCRVPPRGERVPFYNLASRPRLYDQLREDFESIARHLVVPHMDAEGAGYLMLEDVDGARVLDEAGLPRPVIAITIAREFSDKKASLRRLGELMDELTEVYRGLGLGKPALVLDVIFWVTPRAQAFEHPYDADLLEAFGDHAVAVTWYGFIDPFRGDLRGITNDGPRPPMAVWARHLNQHYRLTRDALAADGFPLMIWPGGQTQIDTRVADVEGCRDRGLGIFYHLRSAEDWRTMLTRVLANAWRPPRADGPPLQTVALVTNAGEWYEIGAIDFTGPDRDGQCSFPYNWCEALLRVIREEDPY